MEDTEIREHNNWTHVGGALAGLLLVQLVIGYEWLMSGLTKLVHGDFPGGLASELAEKSEGLSGWYKSFLDGAVIPHASAFGYLIEISELAIGVAFIVAALVWLLAWGRLPSGGRSALLLATAVAALSGIVMNVNFHLANGSPRPWLIPADSFEEAVDLDSLMTALELVLFAVSVRALLSLRPRSRRASPVGQRDDQSLVVGAETLGVDGELTIGRAGTTAGGPRKEMVAVSSSPTRKRSAGWRRLLWALAPLSVGLALGLAFLGGSGGSATASPASEIATLEAKLANLQQDATFWKQLTSVLKPAPLQLRSMQDHRLYALPSGVILGLHFDNMNLAKAKNLNWVVFGVPGTFTKADQQRVTRQFGPGFTHFHDLKADTHGGKPGAKGAWFVHIGARDFQSPFGQVTTGAIDARMMPTPPRS